MKGKNSMEEALPADINENCFPTYDTSVRKLPSKSFDKAGMLIKSDEKSLYPPKAVPATIMALFIFMYTCRKINKFHEGG